MDKASLRTDLLAWRRTLGPDERARAVAQAVAHLVADELWARARTVAVYAALPGEPDLDPLVRLAWSTGRQVALPVVRQRQAPLAWVQHVPGVQLVPGNFRVPEPPATARPVQPADIDLVVVPALAVDDRGHRIGYGGGYYDRSLPLMTGATRVWLGMDRQRVRAVPSEALDVPVHAAVTPSGLVRLPR